MKRIEITIATTPTPWSLFSAAAALLFLACTARAQFYAVTDLGALGGANGMAYAINNHEQIVGTAQTPMGNYHAFMFEGGRMLDLGTMGGSNSWAYGINDMGWMVGAANLPTTNMHAFLCTNALINPVMMDLGTLGGSNSTAWMVDMHGDMVGWASMTNGSHHGFFMTNFVMGDMMDLGTAGGTDAEIYCLNSNRMVAGGAMMSNGSIQPIMSTNVWLGSSGMMTMGMGGMGASGGQTWSIDDIGNTAGMAQMPAGNHHAVVSGNGGMMGPRNVDLGTLGGSNSIAYCLTDAGTVIGSAQMASGLMHAFMVTNALGGMVHMADLNTMIPTNTGWELMEARGMNAAGQIIGWGMHAGRTNAFLLTPVSAPVTMASAPAPQIVGPGMMVSLQGQMSASEPLTYQWLHKGSPIPGATNATLPLQAMSMNNAGLYTLVVRNSVGTVANSSVVVGMFAMQLTNGMPHLTIAASAGSQFRLDYSDALGSGANWHTMTNFTMMGPISQVDDVSSQGSRARFYRAVMNP